MIIRLFSEWLSRAISPDWDADLAAWKVICRDLYGEAE